MISVLDHIEYLSAEYDCVIVPGFGAFISQYSCLKSKNGLVTGLRRNTMFNMAINNNDGLLANSIVRRESVSYESAMSEIYNYVNSLRCQLKHEGEVPVGRIGFLKYHNDESIEFYPFSSWNSNNEYYGLSQLNIQLLTEDTQKEISDNRSNRIVPYAKRFMHIAASIMLLIGLTLVLSTPILEQTNQNYANLNAFTLKNTIDQENRDLYISIPKIEQSIPKTSVDLGQNTNISISKTDINGNYCLVIASLTSLKQAEQYIKENRLTDCEIMHSKSKYRVYIARGTFKEMCTLKTNTYSHSDAWVCHL